MLRQSACARARAARCARSNFVTFFFRGRYEHENIVMLGSKVKSRDLRVVPAPDASPRALCCPTAATLPPSHPSQDTRSTFEKPPDALLVATLPDVVRSSRSPQSKSPLH